MDDSVKRLAEKIYNDVIDSTEPDDNVMILQIESLLREAMEEARMQWVKDISSHHTILMAQERSEAYTRAAEVARKYCRGGDFCLGRGCTACQIAAAIVRLREDTK